MTDPIKALIEAARDHVAKLRHLHASEHSRSVLNLHRSMLLQAFIEPMEAAIAAAEARPEPAPAAPSRWDYVQGACYCRICKQEADGCECEPARPEPAAEPIRVKLSGRFRLLLEEMSATGDRRAWEALAILGDAFEALAREARK